MTVLFNVWYTIENYSPGSIHTNLGIINWFKYLWHNKSWYKKNFSDVLEKVIAILWARKRNNIVFKNYKCNSSFVIELAKKKFYEAIAYNKCTNVSSSAKVAGSDHLVAGENYNLKN